MKSNRRLFIKQLVLARVERPLRSLCFRKNCVFMLVLILIQLISTEDDTSGSPISLSVGENSIRIKEKPRLIEDIEPERKNDMDKWWLKKPEARLEISSAIPVDERGKLSPSPSPDVSSSMKEFLEKERMCKVIERR